MADGKAKGRRRSGFDAIIAAVAEANDCVVVTDNEKDFEGVETINPFEAPSDEKWSRRSCFM
jgi:toxin FitB